MEGVLVSLDDVVVVRVEVDDEMPETALSSSKCAREVKSDLGIQYCGKKRCSQTRQAEVVSKIMWPLRRPRTVGGRVLVGKEREKVFGGSKYLVSRLGRSLDGIRIWD